MATFAAVISTTAPSSPTLYARLLTGTVAAPVTTVARSAMTATVTVGGTSLWELYVPAFDNSLACPRALIDDGSTCWCDGVKITNISQVGGVGYILADGTGGSNCTLNINDSGVPVADADVWITSDAAGTSVVAGVKVTGSDGLVTFLLNPGVTYYRWVQKDGYTPDTGTAFTAVAD